MSQQELVTIPPQTALQVFTVDDGLEPYLALVRAEIDAFVPDITTDKGRKAIASIAYKVSQSKVYLEKVGKALAAQGACRPRRLPPNRN